jgi:hypothetical protein
MDGSKSVQLTLFETDVECFLKLVRLRRVCAFLPIVLSAIGEDKVGVGNEVVQRLVVVVFELELHSGEV